MCIRDSIQTDHGRFALENRGYAGAVGRHPAVEHPVEPPKEPAEKEVERALEGVLGGVVILEQESGEGGREGQGVEGGDDRGNRNSQGKLFEELRCV